MMTGGGGRELTAIGGSTPRGRIRRENFLAPENFGGNCKMTDKFDRRPGRPLYSPSADQRRAVVDLRLSGASELSIARALRIDPATLQRHFAAELSRAFAIHQSRVLEQLAAAADRGSVAAIVRLDVKLMAGARARG